MTGAAGQFDGKVVLITGGTRGLGREMAYAFAARGARLVISGRTPETCREIAEDITWRTGSEAIGIACHMANWDAIAGLVDSAYERFGALDCVINNAGISPTYDRLVGVSEELWDKTIGVNLKGPFRLTTLAGERMKAAGAGTIVNISSVASIRPAAGWLPYSAAKAGLNALTEGFAQALGPEVRVNCVVCGAFQTDIASSWDETATAQRMKDTTALERVGRPAEIVGAAMYLAGDDSGYTTGALLRVDGGRV
ncbi:SDR family oxidoreductase [Amycolatopsis sp. K13G38]|uniref:SDR family oxidoreductase n=1 Tax=Amycolatopsis acididurans TaxID=2724524 RepID=A0ABX1JBA3_9PSEU|nr:SDR family oxidoreductase [Amycolatopsis acididurans]NKQ56169.1 SDR family oxidoreductase [Amycolatopsis acididurans]